MRFVYLILFFSMISCNQQAQENETSQEESELLAKKALETSDNISKFQAMDVVRIDTIGDIAKGIDERLPTFIKKRLEALVGNYLKNKCIENSIQYPPKFILYRFFKQEREFEVWAGNSQNDSLRRILLLPVCAVDDQAGTKLQEGDGKTPEGFYDARILYGSSENFMWIKLNNSEIATYGKVGYGSSFKMCLDYPNSLDRLQTKTILKDKSPGSAICIHGNCVSIGCISFENKNYLPVFLAALYHDSKNYGPIKIHVFPFRFGNKTMEVRQKLAHNVNHMSEPQVLDNWNNLEEAYALFNQKRRALKIRIQKDKYSYSIQN